MQSGIEETIAARAALLALGATIGAELAQVVASLRGREPADACHGWSDEVLHALAEVEGALAHAGQSGLRALVRLLRMQLLAAEGTDAVPPADLADSAQWLAHTLQSAFERLLQAGEVQAADLLPCWQRLAALGGAIDASPAELLSLRLLPGEFLPLPSAPPCVDPLADAERALLACLRAYDDSGRAGAVHAFAEVLAAVAAQEPAQREHACWRILHAYVLELAQAGGLLPVRDKKILAATIRALRQRYRYRDCAELTAVLEPLAREALFALSAQRRRTQAGDMVARLFRVDIQCAALMSDGWCASGHDHSVACVAASVARAIAVLDSDGARLGEAAVWHALAADAGRAPPTAALASPLNRLAARVPDFRDEARRELLAAVLLGLQAWADDGGGDAIGLAAVLDLASQADTATATQALCRHMQAISMRRRLVGLYDTICTELAAAEPALEAAWQGVGSASALAGVDDVLRQVAGALALFGQHDHGDAVAQLRALLARVTPTASDLQTAMQPLAEAWVQLSATLALRPAQVSAPPTDDAPAAGLAAAADRDDQAYARLCAIFIEEAGGHLRNVRRLAGDACLEQERANALRSVHTVAGCSATIGQTAMAGLALALEDHLMVDGWQPDDALLGETLNALDAMLDDFVARGQCEPQPALLARLQAGLEPPDGCDQVASDDAVCHAHAGQHECLAGADDEPAGVDNVTSLPACPLQAGVDATPAGDTAMLSLPAPASSQHAAPADEGETPELQAIFDEEAADLLPQLEFALCAWQQQPDSREPPMQLLRVLHTLKGSARMAGRPLLGEEFHQAEAEVAALAQQAPAMVLQALPALQERMDRWMPQADAFDRPATGTASDASEVAEVHVAPAAGVARTSVAGPLVRAEPVAVPQLRVAAGQLARVADAAATLWVGNASIHDAVQDQRHAVTALSGDLARLRTQLRELEIESESRIVSRAAHGNDAGFDPLEFDRYTRLHELTRMMAESIGDLAGAQRGLARQVERLASSAAVQARDMRQLQLDLQAMRSQPLGSAEPRLRLLLRQAARDAGCEAELALCGADVEIERSLLDRLAGPFGHLLRNAVVHGIEPAEQRAALGKPRAGTVTIGATLAGNELRLWLEDDGRGLDLDRVHRHAVAAGLLGPDELPDDAALAALIFAPGFSTATEVTAWSGRGIGMDAVRAELQALGGRIAVDSVPGQGCRFTITVPIALASLPVLLVSAGLRRVALAVAQVQQVVQPGPGQIECKAGGWQIGWQGQWLALCNLGQVIGAPSAARADDAARLPVAIVQEGERQLALQLDAVLGQREVMVKHPGAQLAQVPGVAGATVLGDGGIVLILDPFRMPATPPAPTEPVPARPLVLVVDDSLTVRRASQRLLERHGYAVVLARDGIEALERLGEVRPMALLLDIEMPRMDGFELLAALRADAGLSALPVLMITSRIADRHRERAQQLGVLAYMGKPLDEQALLAQLAGLRCDAKLAA